MHSDRLSRTNGDGQATTIPDHESAKTPQTIISGNTIDEDVTNPVPLQMPILDDPSITLQYDPAGKPVENVALHALSQLLIATRPSEPM